MQSHTLLNSRKVLFLLNRLVLSGQSIDVIPLAHYLAKENYDIHILYGQKDKDEQDALYLTEKYPVPNIKKIDSLYRNVSPVKDIRAFFFVYNYIRSFRPAIIHTHGAKAGLIGRIAAKLAGVKVIIHTFHGNLFHAYYNAFISSLIRGTEKFLAGISTAIIALSREQQRELTDVYRIAPENKVSIIYLGIDKKDYLKNTGLNRLNFRNKYRLAGNDIAIGIIGRMVPVKNHVFFIKVIAKLLLRKKSNVYFFFMGDGGLKTELEQVLDNHSIEWSENENVSAPVIFTSWIYEVAEVIHGLDIVALTSLNEGTPVSLIEAQLCSKPVVACNVGGVKDTLIDGETGFLIDEFDLDSFVAKMSLLIEDENLRKVMAEKAAQFASVKFSKAREVQQTIQLYNTCLKSKGIINP